RAYDALAAGVLSRIDVSAGDEDVERSITQLLEPQIHRAMSGDEPFYPQHGAYEDESRKPPPAQPPCYDIAFVMNANPRLKWVLEAKLMRTDGRVAEYIADVRNEFMTCRYSPFSGEGAMVGYLLAGTPSVALQTIAAKLGCALTV